MAGDEERRIKNMIKIFEKLNNLKCYVVSKAFVSSPMSRNL